MFELHLVCLSLEETCLIDLSANLHIRALKGLIGVCELPRCVLELKRSYCEFLRCLHAHWSLEGAHLSDCGAFVHIRN